MAHAVRFRETVLAVVAMAGLASCSNAQSNGASAEAAMSLDNLATSKLQLRVDHSLFVSLSRSGGTGFFWDGGTANPAIATIDYLKSERSTPASNTVGVPERDIFEIKGRSAGETGLFFDLKRARGEPTRSFQLPVRVDPD